ncbi:hypothetical protein SCHPADRAFT_929932 [Schizopora paradoxa]|uniref:NACHT domain-containing protein n=1 Tax=Schizopora paradoxa TaxID=27342 RepID=A0A0H2RHJ0_9AGAM|nr:hypothetical protein SCHPADRAFT_929932 [Schizopora paradoxa]
MPQQEGDVRKQHEAYALPEITFPCRLLSPSPIFAFDHDDDIVFNTEERSHRLCTQELSAMKISDASIAAIRLLEALNEATDVFPPLKSAVGGALHIANLVKEFRSNKNAWAQFAVHVQKNIALVAQALADQQANVSPPNNSLEDLNKVLSNITDEIEGMQRLKPSKHFLSFMKDPELIQDMEKELARAMSLFHLDAEIQTHHDISEIIQNLTRLETDIVLIQANQDNSKQALLSLELPYAHGATWSPALMCQSGTRTAVLGEIMEWIGDYHDDSSAQIFCLTGVPGAGKTAISHSVAKQCADKGWLSTAFFFSREDSLRPSKLFSTIALDLSGRYPSFRKHVSEAIRKDPSLSGAGLMRQFSELLCNFSYELPRARPIVVVLDALDEGYSTELLQIMIGDISSLPGIFRIFVTSRDIPEVQRFLQAKHVHPRKFDHRGGLGLGDVAMVAQSHLKDVAEELQVEGWPSENMMERFVLKSEGLMIWIVAICQYLKASFNPQIEFKEFLEKTKFDHHEDAEEQMDKLYVAILENFRWKDKRFAASYNKFMGTILASNAPLSANAIKALHSNTVEVSILLRYLKPLLLFTDGNLDQPIQILHHSLFDLLTVRAHNVERWHMFAIDRKLHSEELALCCLKTLNTELTEGYLGTGYLDAAERGIPKLADGIIPEHILYACQFWMAHILEITNPTQELIELLETFLVEKFDLWLQVSLIKGNIQEVSLMCSWIEDTCASTDLQNHLCNEYTAKSYASITYHLIQVERRHEALTAAHQSVFLTKNAQFGENEALQRQYARTLISLSDTQSNIGLKEDALLSIQEAVDIHRKVMEQNPSVVGDELAWCMKCLSERLLGMGLLNAALPPITEAVDIYKHLALETPRAFDDGLGWCLLHLSNVQSKLGLRDEALSSIQHAVDIYRNLIDESTFAFQDELAWVLNSLSKKLLNLGIKDEALLNAKESVKIYRQLSKENPISHKFVLAWSLGTLSQCLLSVSLDSDALQTIQEAILLFKQLDDTEKDPAIFKVNIAWCQIVLSDALSALGMREEALQAIKNSVGIFRKLAERHPNVFKKNLARSLQCLSSKLLELGYKEEALHAVKEAVQEFEILFQKEPNTIDLDFAKTLVAQLLVCSNMEQDQESTQAMQKAVDIYKQLASKYPTAYTLDIMEHMNKLSLTVSDTPEKFEVVGTVDTKGEEERRRVDTRRQDVEHGESSSTVARGRDEWAVPPLYRFYVYSRVISDHEARWGPRTFSKISLELVHCLVSTGGGFTSASATSSGRLDRHWQITNSYQAQVSFPESQADQEFYTHMIFALRQIWNTGLKMTGAGESKRISSLTTRVSNRVEVVVKNQEGSAVRVGMTRSAPPDVNGSGNATATRRPELSDPLPATPRFDDERKIERCWLGIERSMVLGQFNNNANTDVGTTSKWGRVRTHRITIRAASRRIHNSRLAPPNVKDVEANDKRGGMTKDDEYGRENHRPKPTLIRTKLQQTRFPTVKSL